MSAVSFVCASPIFLSSKSYSLRKDRHLSSFHAHPPRVLFPKRPRCCSPPPTESHNPSVDDATTPKTTRAIFFNTSPTSRTAQSGNPITATLSNLTLPAGFPTSVASPYIPFSLLNVLRQLFRTAYYTLGTSTLLAALSLDTASNGASLPLSAALTWALKDGLGLAAQAFLSSTLGPTVDGDPKRARMHGEFLMALSGVLEVSAPLAPSLFLPLASAAGVLRRAGDSLSGPAYRVFLDALARAGNIGDVSARAEAQVVFGKVLGLGVGAVIVAAVAKATEAAEARLLATGAAFAVLAVGHLAVSRAQVATVELKTLNAQRLNIILDEFCRTGRVPAVGEVNRLERVVYVGRAGHKEARKVLYGVEPRGTGEDGSCEVPRMGRHFLVKAGGGVGVAFRMDASTRDILLATLEARRLLQSSSRWESESMQSAQRWAMSVFDDFETQLKTEGWDSSRFLSPIGKMKYSTIL